ncbi:hypothetical protein B4135_0430 [Caldibacillus debilis]|uniref:Uncharacterized protein n=1 Tax=Caldibacillus debilis TaxID=301148 RepID=A0A150L8T5_9BACI|nr:hypothetical protein B4135_0430 [Caldibacillus debilis]
MKNTKKEKAIASLPWLHEHRIPAGCHSRISTAATAACSVLGNPVFQTIAEFR